MEQGQNDPPSNSLYNRLIFGPFLPDFPTSPFSLRYLILVLIISYTMSFQVRSGALIPVYGVQVTVARCYLELMTFPPRPLVALQRPWNEYIIT